MNSMPPVLVSQSFSAGEVAADAKEKNRLLAALNWNFEFTFMYMVADKPRVTVSYNRDDAATDPQQDEFTITSLENDGIITLTANRSGSTRSMTMIEIIPAGAAEIEVISVDEDRRVIRFRHENDLLTLGIKVSEIGIRRQKSADAQVEIEDLPPSQFAGPIFPSLPRKEVFRFDKLTDKQDLESLIAELFALLFDDPGDLEFGISCGYICSPGPSLPEVTLPVLLVRRVSSAEHKNIAANLAEGIKEWWSDFTPLAGGAFNFEVSASAPDAAERREMFSFSRLVLPSAVISDLPAA
jgi:hypothetical protein